MIKQENIYLARYSSQFLAHFKHKCEIFFLTISIIDVEYLSVRKRKKLKSPIKKKYQGFSLKYLNVSVGFLDYFGSVEIVGYATVGYVDEHGDDELANEQIFRLDELEIIVGAVELVRDIF